MMKSTKDLLEFLDLSHLSTDEELAIRQVLQRDDNLRKRETGRIRRLQISIPDPKKLKVMTGEWFEELRTRRYGRQSDVAEVLRSSMRRKKPTVFRTSTFSDVGQRENKEGEKENKDPQTKASEIQTPDTSFLNLSFCEKANQELSNEESTGDTEHPATSQKPPSEVVTPMDTWEDEGLDSDDDCSSVSSYGSDFSARRGYGSIALGLTGRTGSLLSVYSEAGDFGSVTVQGAVEFSLRYRNAEELIVTVEQCQDLAYANPRKQRTDPYVKTYLHPDKSRHSKKKTSIKKRTINPVFGGETLKYKMTMDDLKGRTLNLSVWHNDSRGRNVFLGQVDIDLKTWDWGHETLTWYNLQPKNPGVQDSPEYHGLLTVALKYIPPGSTGVDKINSGEVHVWLKEARELRKLKPQGVDSFVKCYMLPDTSKKSRQKTRVVKKSLKPVYNHAMVYDGFRAGEVREACCELTVWDHNKLSNQFLGGVRLSLGTGQSYGKNVNWMESVNEEIQLWENMLSSPDAWVEGEIPLRSSMTPRK
uniref:Synaptotagmin-like protein 1 n=1 Tax=Oncorhynchus kisutch TaxID=8019 RepID=A0A8C7LY15_ONCKI